MADSGWRFHCKGKILSLKPQGYIYQADQYRYLYKRTNDSCKGLVRVYPENCHGHGNGQLKIV